MHTVMMPNNNDDGEMQLANKANVEPTHDSDASSISSNGVQNGNTLSNVSPDTLNQLTDTSTFKSPVVVVLKPVKNYQI